MTRNSLFSWYKRLHTKRRSQVAFPKKNVISESCFQNYQSQKGWSFNCNTHMQISWLREAVALKSYLLLPHFFLLSAGAMPAPASPSLLPLLQGSIPLEKGQLKALCPSFFFWMAIPLSVRQRHNPTWYKKPPGSSYCLHSTEPLWFKSQKKYNQKSIK